MSELDKSNDRSFDSWLWLWATIIFLSGVIIILVSDRVQLPDILGRVLHEVGFACIVASIVWIIFERFSERNSERAWRKRSEKIAEDVFYGVLRRRLPKQLLAAANELILAQDLIRRELRLEYEISDGGPELQKIYGCPVVRLDTHASYKLINVGEKTVPHKVALSLPNAILPDDKQFPILSSTVIRQNGQPISQADTLLANAVNTKRVENDRVTFDIANINLAPDEEVFISVEYSLLKHENDSEVVQTTFASDSISIIIRDRKPGTRQVGARALHRDKLTVERNSPISGMYEYSLDKFLLPHQGVIVWWSKHLHRN